MVIEFGLDNMTNFNLSECDVLEILKQRFKITPVRIEPWTNQVIIVMNAVTNQSKNFTWRFDRPVQDGGAVTSNISFPFFIESLELNVYNDDPLQASIANTYVSISNPIIETIDNNYNYINELIQRYGVGTFAGSPFPAAAIVENNQFFNRPIDICAPFITVDAYADLGGAIYLSLSAKFQGYLISLS